MNNGGSTFSNAGRICIEVGGDVGDVARKLLRCQRQERRARTVRPGAPLTAAPIVPSAPVTRMRRALLIAAAPRRRGGPSARHPAASAHRSRGRGACPRPGGWARRPCRARLKRPGSNTATSARAAPRGGFRGRRGRWRSAGWPVRRMDGVLRGEQPSSRTMKRQNHDAHVYAPWKNDSAKFAVRREGGRVRAGHAELCARTPRAAGPRSRRG